MAGKHNISGILQVLQYLSCVCVASCLSISLSRLKGQSVEEPNLKKSVIEGDKQSVKGPTKNLHILTIDVVTVVLMTDWGSVFPNQWEYHGLPLTSCVIQGLSGMFQFFGNIKHRMSMETCNIPTVFQSLSPIHAVIISSQPLNFHNPKPKTDPGSLTNRMYQYLPGTKRLPQILLTKGY